MSYRCGECKHEWRRVVKEIPKSDPKCPECRKAKRIRTKSIVSTDTHDFDGMESIISSGKAPGVNGSNIAKAMDATANMVMQDYGMSNLNDARKAGDVMAPKLPPVQQARADAMFAGRKKGMLQNGSQVNMQAMMGRQAMAGKFKPDADRNPVQMTHEARTKPKVNIVAGDL